MYGLSNYILPPLFSPLVSIIMCLGIIFIGFIAINHTKIRVLFYTFHYKNFFKKRFILIVLSTDKFSERLTLWNRLYIPNYKLHLTPQGKLLLRVHRRTLKAWGPLSSTFDLGRMSGATATLSGRFSTKKAS